MKQKTNGWKSLLTFLSGLLGTTTVTYFFYVWFVQTAFLVLPNITFWQALGLRMFALSLQVTNLSQTYLKDDLFEKSKAYRDNSRIAIPWVILLIGYIIHLCIR